MEDPYVTFNSQYVAEPLSPKIMTGAVTKTKVQRDPRTPLTLKKMYVGLSMLCMALGLAIAFGAQDFNKKCETYRDQVGKDWGHVNETWPYYFVAFWSGWIIFSLVILFRPEWAWLTTRYGAAPKYGEDVEDFDPGYLSREGTRLAINGLETERRMSETRVQR